MADENDSETPFAPARLPSPQSATEPPSPAGSVANPLAVAKPKLRSAAAIDLDLSRNRQQQSFEPSAKPLQITDLEGCDAAYEIKPESITIKVPHDIVIDVSWENLANGRRRVNLEATITNDAGKKLPFTLRTMEAAKRQATQAGEQATAALAALRLEQQNLSDYIKSAQRRSPAQDNAARARLDQLKKLIPLGDAQLRALQADYLAATQLLDLAQTLDEKCHVLLDPVDPVEGQ